MIGVLAEPTNRVLKTISVNCKHTIGQLPQCIMVNEYILEI